MIQIGTVYAIRESSPQKVQICQSRIIYTSKDWVLLQQAFDRLSKQTTKYRKVELVLTEITKPGISQYTD